MAQAGAAAVALDTDAGPAERMALVDRALAFHVKRLCELRSPSPPVPTLPRCSVHLFQRLGCLGRLDMAVPFEDARTADSAGVFNTWLLCLAVP